VVTGFKTNKWDNVNNARWVTERNREREYLKDRINEPATHSKNKSIRDLYREMNKFKKGYQARPNLVKDENGDLIADSYNIMNR
jgi:hypothetical protein